MEEAAYLHQFVEETDWYNGIVLGSLMPGGMWRSLPRPVQSWLRNYIGGTILYFLSGFLWCFYIYYWKRNVYVPKDAIPSKNAMMLQIGVAMKAMPWYCALPSLSEYMIENGWTRCYSSISEVGVPVYLAYLAIYMIIVEFGIYWMHRELHDIKPLYKLLHATHHIYNKQNTLSPFAALEISCRGALHMFWMIALHVSGFCRRQWCIQNLFAMHPTLWKMYTGLAFHPLDGILQAVPHVICLFLVPTHFLSHILLLFIEAIWTANIHDCIHGKVWPIMGAGYHTIHHTTYRHNYGHYTIWMDWAFGTLRDPEAEEGKVA